jgi:hypothetical protein
MSKKARAVRYDLEGCHVHPEEGAVPCGKRFMCGAPGCKVMVGGNRVEGANAAEVLSVLKEIDRIRSAATGPWKAGFFYLLTLVAVTVVAVGAAKSVGPWLLPAVLGFALAAGVIVGVLQQSQDRKISEAATSQLLRAALDKGRRRTRQVQGDPAPPA